MKKLALIFFPVIMIGGFNACNNADNKKKEPVATDSASIRPAQKRQIVIDDCTGIENLVVDRQTAEAMINRYNVLYKKLNTNEMIPHLSNSVWIDEMIINSYGAFFETNGKDFDGVRFVNGTVNNNNDSKLLMVPTKPAADNKHTDIWQKGLIRPLTGNSTQYQDWETNADRAETLMNNFRTIYRSIEGVPYNKNPLSESVWISSCVFKALRALIEDPDNQIDGVMVYFGAYEKIMNDPEVPGQFHPNQSTVLLVPTSSDGNQGHTPRWDIIKSQVIVKKIRPNDNAYNHGELCPSRCGD